VNTADAAGLLDLIAARAPALRQAGVLSVELDGVAFTLAPPEPPDPVPETRSPDDAEDVPRDALRDPATHGLFGEDARRPMPRRMRTPLIAEHDE